MTALGQSLTLGLSPSRLPQFLILVSGGLLVGANIFEHVFGYAPCQLCLYQRLTWWIVLGVACAAAWLMKRRATLAVLISVVAIVAVAAGAVIAGYHAGAEYKWWLGPSGCSGAQELTTSLADAINSVGAGPAPPACDEVPWSLFGISMAGYNFLISIATILVAGALTRRALKTE